MQQTFETWITPIMIGGLILFMGFIIWDLAKKSNAGRFGTLMLFVVLGAGILGYVFKVVITWALERGGV
jgi:predicted RND superfamily exporter protein